MPGDPPIFQVTPQALTSLVELIRPFFSSQSSTVNPMSIDSQFANLHTSISLQDKSRNQRMDYQEGLLKEIKEQAMKTNGRVTTLENKWRWAVGWLMGASAAVAGIVQIILHFWK